MKNTKQNKINLKVNLGCWDQLKRMNDLKEVELAHMDRMDISRREYEEMKAKIEHYKNVADAYERFFKSIKADQYAYKVKEDTVVVVEHKEVESQRHYVKIVFQVKDISDLPEY